MLYCPHHVPTRMGSCFRRSLMGSSLWGCVFVTLNVAMKVVRKILVRV